MRLIKRYKTEQDWIDEVKKRQDFQKKKEEKLKVKSTGPKIKLRKDKTRI